MKKVNIWSLMTFCFCLLGALTMTTACGDDDDDNNSGGGGTGIQGTWTYAYTISDTESQTRHGVELTLVLGDNTYELKVIQRHDDKLSGDYREEFGEGERGNYTFANGRLTFTPTGISFYESLNGRTPSWSAWEENVRDSYSVGAQQNGNKLAITEYGQNWYWYMGDDVNTLTLTRK